MYKRPRFLQTVFFLVLTIILLSLPELKQAPSKEISKPVVVAIPVQSAKNFDRVLVAKASWYGVPFHGRQTANGERYNMYGLSAAHKSLPFGTKVTVTNLKNGKQITVPINDRGPYIAGRAIDLSFGAASALDMLHDGVANVQLAIKLPARRVTNGRLARSRMTR
jgi:rare lipoprotein A